MLEIDNSTFIFKYEVKWFSEIPFDIIGYDGVSFHARKKDIIIKVSSKEEIYYTGNWSYAEVYLILRQNLFSNEISYQNFFTKKHFKQSCYYYNSSHCPSKIKLIMYTITISKRNFLSKYFCCRKNGSVESLSNNQHRE